MTPKPQLNPLAKMLAAMDGSRIVSGCDSCSAEQEVVNRGGGLFILEVRHDPDCPELAQMGKGQS
jgi:hypothetical protein